MPMKHHIAGGSHVMFCCIKKYSPNFCVKVPHVGLNADDATSRLDCGLFGEHLFADWIQHKVCLRSERQN